MSLHATLRKQPATEDKLPKIGRHITKRVIAYDDDRVLLIIKLAGMPFESLGDNTIANRFDARNTILSALAKDKGRRLAIWTTLCREKMSFNSEYAFHSTFMKSFANEYLERFRNGSFYENNFYISLVLKIDDLVEGANELEDIGNMLVKAFAFYDPVYLETYEHNNLLFSEAYEFLGFLLNGYQERIPVTAAPARELIPSSWLHFGYEMLEIRADNQQRYATCYDLKDFPERTAWGQFDRILSLPAEFTLTQTFVCMGIFEAQKAISSQINKLQSAKDKALHQINELHEAIGYISSGELAFGEYHGALVVYGDTEKKAADNGTLVTSAFLGECGTRFVKATISAPYTYLSQIPGTKLKPRPMLKSTRNLAAAFGMHNYSSGKAVGNPIGDGTAVIPLQTASHLLYNFNFHPSPKGKNNLGQKIAAHTFMTGKTGSGKTTVECGLIGFLERFSPKIFAIDKDESLKIFLCALGGTYYSLKEGVSTGLAPFQLPNTPVNRQFLYNLVATCGQDSHHQVTAEERLDIKKAVDAVLSLDDPQHRQFSRLLENIPDRGENCLARRLHKWCHCEGGEFAWALDNVSSQIDITSPRIIGFDVSDFLVDNYIPSEPVLAFLFHLKRLLHKDGELMATIVEEFWLPLKYKSTRDMILDVLKTGRKRGEFLVMVSQSPEDAIDSEIFAALRDQPATKIWLPNPDAEWDSYQRCGLTEKEFEEFKKLDEVSRKFLIKQGNQSSFAMFDLTDMEDALAVLSGSTENVRIFDEVVAEVGSDPDVWLPIFQERRTGIKNVGTIRKVSQSTTPP